RALTLMGLGVAIGSAGALALTRVLSGMLYEIRPTDAATFLGAAVLLAVIAVAAGLLPAWRATRVDPLLALRGGGREGTRSETQDRHKTQDTGQDARRKTTGRVALDIVRASGPRARH